MEGRSALLDAAVRAGGSATAAVDVRRGGVLLATNLPVRPGGSVAIDGTAAARRTLAVEVVDESGALRPDDPTDALAPYGSEADVSVGFRYVDGTTERVRVGVFRLTSAVSTSEGLVSLTGVDRSSVVAAARFEVPYVIAAGTNLGTAIQSLIESRYPGLTYNFTTTTRTVPLTVFEEGDRSGDPWSNALDLARAGGMELFFDVRGQPTLRPVPDPNLDPIVWTYSPGPTSILLTAANRLSSEDVRNVAIVRGEGTGVTTPIRATAEVTDPASPIFPGTFGRRPIFLVSSLITTQAQADEAAAALLRRKAGGGELLSFSAVGHPAHEAGDVVQVVSPMAGVDDFVVLSKWRLPLGLQEAVDYETLGRRSA